MFVRTPLQAKLFPCDYKYNEKEISDLKKSWAEVIKNKVLPSLGKLESKFASFYHKTMGRPIKYISLLIVVHIFKEMSSRTLQNPADEDVTCGYKGPGYEATFAETCSPENPFQVITDVQVDPSAQSDQHKTLQVVERLDAQNLNQKFCIQMAFLPAAKISSNAPKKG